MENTPSAVPEETPVTVNTGRSKVFGFVIFILLVIAFAGIAALWHQLQQSREQIDKTQKKLFVYLKDQEAAQNTIKTQNLALSKKIETQQNAISQMNAQLAELMKLAPADHRSWKMAEVAYLIRMANLELKVQHNVPDALVLLRQAESRLNTLQDASLDNLHAALLKNISALQIIPLFDIDTLTTQLSNLRDQVPSLSILVAPKPNTSILENTPHQSHKKWWQRAWDNIKATTQQLVIVRHQSEKIPAFMTPEQQMYLQENLKLLLMQTQWALLNHNAAIYQKSLKQAQSWVKQYYVQNSASTQEFLKQIQSLIDQNISPVVPDLSQTIALVHEEGI